MVDNNVDPDELRNKLEEYSTFIDKTLHPELQKAVASREEVEAEIAEYQELRDKIILLQGRKESLQKPLESLVDLGHKTAYCRAVVDDPQTIFVHVGMGFHTEFTLKEATFFIEKRIQYLEKDVLVERLKKAKTVAAHLESSLLILETLAKEVHALES
mmetsp:Transcript_3339/g.4826  ORF Transcript_3339/g.4826 Transcript_3339/m.4826 type:complete len:158 (+) Transcript_3339:26-499(+)